MSKQITQSPSQQEIGGSVHAIGSSIGTASTAFNSGNFVQQRQQSSHTRQPGANNSVLGKHKSPLPFFAAQNVLGSSMASLRTPFRQSYQEPFNSGGGGLTNTISGTGTAQAGSTMSIRSGGLAAPSSQLLEDRRNINFGVGGMERSQKILDQSSQEVLDYLGAYESSIDAQ